MGCMVLVYQFTVPLDVEGLSSTRGAVIAESRKRYGTPKAKIEKQMEQLFKADGGRTSENKKTNTKSSGPRKVHGA